MGYILNSKVSLTTQIDNNQIGHKIFLRTEFNSPEIVNAAEYAKIQNNVIEKVELVFTTFRESQTFDQKKLNKKRINSLLDIAPNIKGNDLIEWKVTGQTACASPESGRDFFHGFIITFREEPSEATLAKEMAYIESILSGKDPVMEISTIPVRPIERTEIKKCKIEEVREELITSDKSVDGEHTYVIIGGSDPEPFKAEISTLDELPRFKGGPEALRSYLTENTYYPILASSKGINGTVTVSFLIDPSGKPSLFALVDGIGGGCNTEAIRVTKAMPTWIPAKRDGKAIGVLCEIKIHFELYGDKAEGVSGIVNYMSVYDAPYYFSVVSYAPSISYKPFVPDSSVYKVLERNSQWNKMAIVCDFTSSMYPYSSQLLIWHKLNFNTNKDRIELFTFFNDGDYKPLSQKPIGDAGGIYYSKAQDFKDVKKLALTTMRNGIGGLDIPENNIEALIKSIEKCPECEDIVMIADNFATPRDLILLSKVDRPIKVIMCGASGGINIAYLNMVKQNGGSIHTMEQDITDLMNVNEGGKITIGEASYRVRNGKFVRVYKM